MPGRRSLILWTTGAAAAVVVALLVVRSGQELRIRWACEQARQELLAAKDRGDEPPRALKDYLGGNETSYSVFARLLRADDPAVWIHVLKHAYWNAGARRPDQDTLSPFELYLRDREPVVWVKYLLPEPYQHGTDWRGRGSTLAFDYWSGQAGQPLAPRPEVLAFLRGFLAGVDEEASPVEERSLRPGDRLDLERRAVYALRAMVAARPPPAAAIELLRWTVAEHRYPPVRLAALSALTVAESFCDEVPPCVVRLEWDFERLFACESHFHFLANNIDEFAMGSPVHEHHRVELLAHLDSSFALCMLVRLQAKPEHADAVARALGPERGRWLVPKPAWLPLEAAAARYLASPSLDERAAAMLSLVELGTPAARDALAAHEPNESHAELRLLTRSGMAALGDAGQRQFAEQIALARLDAEDSERGRQENSMVILDPARWPWCAASPGGGWSEPYRIESTHLARHLLLAGSRPTLDRMVKLLVDRGESPLDLTRHIDGLPLTPWGDLLVDAGEITFSTDREEERRQLGDWWQANAGRLQWDAARRKFTVVKAPDSK